MGKIIVMHMWNTFLEYISSKITTLRKLLDDNVEECD